MVAGVVTVKVQQAMVATIRVVVVTIIKPAAEKIVVPAVVAAQVAAPGRKEV